MAVLRLPQSNSFCRAGPSLSAAHGAGPRATSTMLFITPNAASITALLCSVIVSAGLSLAFSTPRLPSKSPILQLARNIAPSRPTSPRNIAPSRPTSSLLSKWDNLVDEDDDDDGGLDFGEELPGPRDMRYIEFNIGRQNRNFVDIRTAGGPEMTLDVYSRKPGDDVFGSPAKWRVYRTSRPNRPWRGNGR